MPAVTRWRWPKCGFCCRPGVRVARLPDAFLRQGGGRTALLPRLMPLGDIDEDELAIFEAGQEPGAASAADLPPAIPGLKRQLLLTRAVMALPDHSMQPAQATALALELGKLIDRMATEDCDPGALATLVADNYAEHWQKVLPVPRYYYHDVAGYSGSRRCARPGGAAECPSARPSAFVV